MLPLYIISCSSILSNYLNYFPFSRINTNSVYFLLSLSLSRNLVRYSTILIDNRLTRQRIFAVKSKLRVAYQKIVRFNKPRKNYLVGGTFAFLSPLSTKIYLEPSQIRGYNLDGGGKNSFLSPFSLPFPSSIVETRERWQTGRLAGLTDKILVIAWIRGTQKRFYYEQE